MAILDLHNLPNLHDLPSLILKGKACTTWSGANKKALA